MKKSGKGALATMGKTAPMAVDSSYGCKGGKVDKDAIRGGTAPSPRTLGPRDA